eukprot:TRINITY_DN61022_c0_g1_i1.p1 TRINITY_DN61022_c0_g1~~TRINITY_DN61022_c0_g1_i1.p1  ORF type:complete len:588 (-),score=119.79 TRINITY_DN61022_c0_g1_i1:192-1955(-)
MRAATMAATCLVRTVVVPANRRVFSRLRKRSDFCRFGVWRGARGASGIDVAAGATASVSASSDRPLHGAFIPATSCRGSQGKRYCSAAGSSSLTAAVQLPTAPFLPGEGVLALQRWLQAVEEAGQDIEAAWEEPAAARFLDDLVGGLADYEPQQLRAVLAACAKAMHLPITLGMGLAVELPRALRGLPDMHAVHVALLMASLELPRGHSALPAELLEEVVEQLEGLAEALPPTGLVGGLVALSQLGPWPASMSPGAPLAESVIIHLQDPNALGSNQLSAVALAAATLGINNEAFWQAAHAALLTRIGSLGPRHIADTLLALATTQRCPIFLMEELQARLRVPGFLDDVDGADEALALAWSLCSLELYPPNVLNTLLERVCIDAIAHADEDEHASAALQQASRLSEMQSNNLRQVVLALELEPSAVKARAAISEEIWSRLRAHPAAGERSRTSSVMQEIGELVVEHGGTAQSEDVFATDSSGFYTIDLVVRAPVKVDASSDQCPGDDAVAVAKVDATPSPSVALLIDDVSPFDAAFPQDPWMFLKRRQLQHLSCRRVIWLPAKRWYSWDADERRDFVLNLFDQLRQNA